MNSIVAGPQLLKICRRCRILFGLGLFLLFSYYCAALPSPVLDMPPRATNAPTGKQFLERISGLDLPDREKEISAQILAGNVPNSLRQLCPVQVTNVAANGRTNRATFYVAPEYLCVGSDEDYFLTPITPQTAQTIAEALKCSLPTRQMVDAIYRNALVKLAPSPILPSPAMTTIPVFSNHNFVVFQQRKLHLTDQPLGALVAGHKKDVVICADLTNSPGKVAIYGWHKPDGQPIQPLYLGHADSWVDYSQCIRLVSQRAMVNDRALTLSEVLADPRLAGLLSDEGPLPIPRYFTNTISQVSTKSRPVLSKPPGQMIGFIGFQDSPRFQERVASFTIVPDVKVHINMPGEEAFQKDKSNLLIFYALPNGNTTVQTIGKILKTGDDWHLDIQHIGAQTRLLRKMLPEKNVIIAYLENSLKSWPAWRKANGDNFVPEILTRIKSLCPTNRTEWVLSGHSGGGSLIFGYLNSLERIPDEIARITFLDSNYAYDQGLRHDRKLADWLNASDQHFLCVLAYHDSIALLDGKTFVSAAGGTWGRSHAMQSDLARHLRFQSSTNSGFERYSALYSRVQFILKENPEKKILHTVQVERNGFIHSIVSGTPKESVGYEYFGDRAYSQFISPDPEL